MLVVLSKIDNPKKSIVPLQEIVNDDNILEIIKAKALDEAKKLNKQKELQDIKKKVKEDVEEIQKLEDTVRQYLNQIGKYKVLEPEVQKELGRRIQKGDKEARQELILTNLKLVVSIAKKRKYAGKGIELLDLIQEGNTGLFKAVDRFDPEKFPDNTFNTYAQWWIKQRIRKAIDERSKTIKVPSKKMLIINRMKYTYVKLAQDLFREPTIDEVAEKLEMKVSEIEEFLKLNDEVLSLNFNYGENEDTELLDFVEDTKSLSTEENIDRIKIKENIDKILKSLSPREEQIIRMRFGIGGYKETTLEEIGGQNKRTRERIRQIEAKAIEKLRKNKKTRKILLEILGK